MVSMYYAMPTVSPPKSFELSLFMSNQINFTSESSVKLGGWKLHTMCLRQEPSHLINLLVYNPSIKK